MSTKMVLAGPVRDGRVLNGKAMRERVLDAAIKCLVHEGYAGTSTVRIAELAGVSRGAQLHHFQTRHELLAAAVEHLMKRRTTELAARSGDLQSGPTRVGAVLDLVWGGFAGDLFKATLELWTAARTDTDLRVCVNAAEVRLAREIADGFSLLLGGQAGARARFAEQVQFAVEAMWGIAVLDNFHADPRSQARHWAFARRQLVAMFTSDVPSTDR